MYRHAGSIHLLIQFIQLIVKCDKCNRKMTEATLKYKHPKSCPGNESKPQNPKTPKPLPHSSAIQI